MTCVKKRIYLWVYLSKTWGSGGSLPTTRATLSFFSVSHPGNVWMVGLWNFLMTLRTVETFRSFGDRFVAFGIVLFLILTFLMLSDSSIMFIIVKEKLETISPSLCSKTIILWLIQVIVMLKIKHRWVFFVFYFSWWTNSNSSKGPDSCVKCTFYVCFFNFSKWRHFFVVAQ